MIRYRVIAKAPIGSYLGQITSPLVKKDMNRWRFNSRPVILQRGRSDRGFTLVELLVVVSVFVLLVMLTVPNYIATRPQRLLSGETNRLAAVLRQGRYFALRDNAKVYLEFLPEIDTYRLWNASGWRAYSDPIDMTIPRNPDTGHYNGDLDGDGDFWWGTGGDPTSPVGVPEDPDVKNVGGNWVYQDSDGTYLDPDVLLMPSYPGNQPLRTVSPRLNVSLDPSTKEITNITRDLSDTGGVAGDNIFPLEVDLRMEYLTWNPNNLDVSAIGKRNGVLSRFPLIFIAFFPDGTLAASWDSLNSTNTADEIRDLSPGRLGAARIHLQVRSQKYNPEEYNTFNRNKAVMGDEGVALGVNGSHEPLSPFDTLSLEESLNEIYGRVLTINNLSGRVVIKNFPPSELDNLYLNGTGTTYL
jgi:prepilin-type N-terminal cleavage/methylation domain-containing protein